MSLIGTEVKPFVAQAFRNGKFVEVSEKDFKGNWSIICFYPADFTFVC
ncbi:MAG: redoxin domain-containing protein, partial [Bacilli bacterium]